MGSLFLRLFVWSFFGKGGIDRFFSFLTIFMPSWLVKTFRNSNSSTYWYWRKVKSKPARFSVAWSNFKLLLLPWVHGIHHAHLSLSLSLSLCLSPCLYLSHAENNLNIPFSFATGNKISLLCRCPDHSGPLCWNESSGSYKMARAQDTLQERKLTWNFRIGFPTAS